MNHDARPEAGGATLASHRVLRSSVLCLLYFCQGLPWGFATIALLATLSEAGYDKSETATVTAMAILPWTFKFFWAPLIDSVRMPALGARRPWIIFAQLGMALTLLGVWSGGGFDAGAGLMYLAWVLFVHNCFASLQDVATDALAVDLLDDDERGRIIGYMWASKLVGVSAGGAGLAIVVARSGFSTAIAIQAVVIGLVCALVLILRERPGERLMPWSKGSAHQSAGAQHGFLSTLRHVRTALSTRTSFTLLLVAVTAMCAEGLYDPLTTEFFVQKLGWSAEEFATRQGTWGVSGEMAGALGGGLLASRYGGRNMAIGGLLMMMLSLMTFSLTSAAWDHDQYPHAVLLPMFRGWVAFTTVSLFSAYMTACFTHASATQFTLYMALSNIGYSLGAKLNSWLPAAGVSLDHAGYYLFGSLLPVVPIMLLLAISPSVQRMDAATREAYGSLT